MFVCKISIEKWIDNFTNGLFSPNDTNTQISAGWYDWFCEDSLLAEKTKSFGEILCRFKENGKIRLTTNYLWFKNCCPLSGSLYDDIRISDIEKSALQAIIRMNCSFESHKIVFYSLGNNFNEPLFATNNINDFVAWINSSDV